jgi:hypothetical protein
MLALLPNHAVPVEDLCRLVVAVRFRTRRRDLVKARFVSCWLSPKESFSVFTPQIFEGHFLFPYCHP